jgi:hypothetical protein
MTNVLLLAAPCSENVQWNVADILTYLQKEKKNKKNVCCDVMLDNTCELLFILIDVNSLESKKKNTPKFRLTVQLFGIRFFH